MAESVRVICRCRPLNQRELRLTSGVCVEMDPAIGQCILKNGDENLPKTFTFDGVYYMDSTAEQIYNDIVYPLVESVIEGYNGTVFAYGQTGSGKTFSMQGEEQPGPQRGIIPRTFEHIFESIATTEHTKFLVHVSYLEIYNEEIRDLLGKDRIKLEIKEHADQGVYVYGLTMHVCHTVQDCENLMNTGFNNRHVGATLMNKDSSRSHSIFTIYVEALTENGSIRMGKLNLVDLAGSERQAKTGATGERFKEATKINLSLSALGNVISALVDGKSKHIPYRDSKLTRLLQDSLGGNTKTVMIACISPSDNNFDETLSTLRYANRAKNIQNKPKINEDPKDALLREYQEEIQRLKMLVQRPEVEQQQPQLTNAEMEAEKEKLRAEFEHAMGELRASYENEQKSKEKLQQDLKNLKDQYVKASKSIDASGGKPSESGGVVVVSGGILDEEKDAQKRIELLEQQMVGGEQVNNEALKQKRLKKIREAEKKMQRLAEALNVHKDDPLLHVYTSTQDKLDALVQQYNREVQKNKSLESEIHDLQGEFELDRLDYLETIRKQDQHLKLFQQILEQIQSVIRREYNYASIDQIKRDSAWNEDQGRWIVPEIVFQKRQNSSKNNQSYGAVNVDSQYHHHNGNETLPSTSMTTYNQTTGRQEGADSYENDSEEDTDSRLKRKLDKSMDNDFINNYFKQATKVNVLEKYNPERHKNQAKEKVSNFVRRNQKSEPQNGSEDFHSSQESSNSSYKSSSNTLTTSQQLRSASATRKPYRLEALSRDQSTASNYIEAPLVTRNKSFM